MANGFFVLDVCTLIILRISKEKCAEKKNGRGAHSAEVTSRSIEIDYGIDQQRCVRRSAFGAVRHQAGRQVLRARQRQGTRIDV